MLDERRGSYLIEMKPSYGVSNFDPVGSLI
jgi:hypothetical protein